MNVDVFNSVDCRRCTSFKDCGGTTQSSFWGCYDHCLSDCDPNTCDFTCPHNHRKYAERWWEVGGDGPVTLQANTAQTSSWPHYVPVVFGRYKRTNVAATQCAAVPLAGLFKQRRDGEIEPVAGSPEELRSKLRLRTDCRILGSGVAPDADIEWLWYYHDTAPLGKWLIQMGIEAATIPNYSYFAYAPRDHYLWNRKRMLLFAKRLAEDGFPGIPHLYGETPFDWHWWASFFRDHSHLSSFAVELQTSDAEKAHLSALVGNLERFASLVGRPLTAYVAGGRHAIALLAPIFPSLVIVEASAYMKTVRRRFAVDESRGRIRWQKIPTRGGLEPLLDHNIRVVGGSISAEIEAARARKVRIESNAA